MIRPDDALLPFKTEWTAAPLVKQSRAIMSMTILCMILMQWNLLTYVHYYSYCVCVSGSYLLHWFVYVYADFVQNGIKISDCG